MSSLWTPGGEVPVDRERERQTGQTSPSGQPGQSGEAGQSGQAAASGTAGQPSEEEMRERAAELQRFLLETPAPDVVAQHAMGLYELAAIHLSQEQPRLDDAQLAIDALKALLEALEGRLGEAEAQLQEVLPQLQMAYVQVADRVRGTNAGASGSPGGSGDQG